MLRSSYGLVSLGSPYLPTQFYHHQRGLYHRQHLPSKLVMTAFILSRVNSFDLALEHHPRSRYNIPSLSFSGLCYNLYFDTIMLTLLEVCGAHNAKRYHYYKIGLS